MAALLRRGRASCARRGVPAEVYLGSSGMKAADEVRRPARCRRPPSCWAATRSRAGTVTIKDLDLGRRAGSGRRQRQRRLEAPSGPARQTIAARRWSRRSRKIIWRPAADEAPKTPFPTRRSPPSARPFARPPAAEPIDAPVHAAAGPAARPGRRGHARRACSWSRPRAATRPACGRTSPCPVAAPALGARATATAATAMRARPSASPRPARTRPRSSCRSASRRSRPADADGCRRRDRRPGLAPPSAAGGRYGPDPAGWATSACSAAFLDGIGLRTTAAAGRAAEAALGKPRQLQIELEGGRRRGGRRQSRIAGLLAGLPEAEAIGGAGGAVEPGRHPSRWRPLVPPRSLTAWSSARPRPCRPGAVGRRGRLVRALPGGRRPSGRGPRTPSRPWAARKRSASWTRPWTAGAGVLARH